MLPSSWSTATRTRWAGIPAEDRRHGRRDRLVDAAFDLLGTTGEPAVTVRSVCQQAGLNSRYFYESFPDLDALLVAVYERTIGELASRVLDAVAVAGADSRAHTRAAIDTIIGFVDEDRRRGRVLYTEALGNETLNRHRLDTGHALVELVAQSRWEARPAQAPGEVIGRVGAAMLVAGFSGVLQAWIERRIEAPRQHPVDDATTLFLALAEAAGRMADVRHLAPATGPRPARRPTPG